MDEREPLRLLDDPDLAEALRADLSVAKRVNEHGGDADVALARFAEAVAATSTGWSLAKVAWWVSGGLATLGLALTAVIMTREAPKPSTQPATVSVRVVAPAVSAPARPVVTPVTEAPAPLAPPDAREAARRPTARVDAGTRTVSSAPVESPLALLERETLLMSEQRREAQGGDARRSLEIARAASREFPSGHFRVEREAWSIVALHRLGSEDQVRTRAERFLAQHPRAPQAEMIRRMVGAP